MANRPDVTSVRLSNRLKELNINEPSRFFREWTGAKESEVEEFGDYKKFYHLDGINCYTADELARYIIRQLGAKKE